MRIHSTKGKILAFLGLFYLLSAYSNASQAATQPVTVTLHPTTDGAQTPEGPHYIAVFGLDTPWSEPVVETVVEAGGALPAWEIPPGSYRWVCASHGHSVHYQHEPRDLAPGTVTHLDCPVAPLLGRSGRVVTTTDERETRQVVGARVGEVRSFLQDFSLRLSSTGERFLAVDRLELSDEDGRFEIRGPAGFRGEIWIEADGFAPRWLRGVQYDDSAALGPVVLERGGGLVVDLATLPPAGYTRLVLVPDSGVPRALADLGPRVWRRLLGSTGGTFSWPALPAGRYQVHLQGAERGDHLRLPLELGEVEVVAGQIQRLEVREIVQLSADSLEDDAPAPDLVLSLGLDPEKAAALEATLWPAADALTPRTVEQTLTALDGSGSLVTLPGACQQGVHAVLEAPGEEPLISEAIEVDDRLARRCRRGEAEPRPTRLFSASRITGRLRAPTGSALPATGTLSASLCASVDATREGVERPAQRWAVPHLGGYRFAFGTGDDAGRFQVVVPAGCLDLAAEVGDFTPLPLPDVRTPVAATADLGAHTLSFGASVLARILDPSGYPVTGARVSAVPPTELPAAYARAFTRHPEPWSTPVRGRSAAFTDDRGWARLYGLPPGAAHLLVEPTPPEPALSHGAEGAPADPLAIPFAPTDLLPHATEEIALRPRTEELLDEIVLPVPARLEARIAEPPEGDDLTLAVGLEGEFDLATSVVRLRQQVPADETVVFAPLPPGLWRTNARLEGPERSTSFPLAGQILDLFPGAHEILMLETDARKRHGRVTYRGEGLPARLDFLADDESIRKRPNARAAEDGRFTVLVEDEGVYTVRVQQLHPDGPGDEPGIYAMVPQVEVDGARELSIEIPAGEVSGVVVTEDGTPLTTGAVRARQDRELEPEDTPRGRLARRLETGGLIGEDGTFEIVALGPGSWTLEAIRDDLRSDPRVIELAEDSVRANLRLVVRPRSELEVRVVGADGRLIPNATVHRTALAPADGAVSEFTSSSTGVDGTVTWREAPPAGSEISIAVTGPGLTTEARRALVPAEGPLTVTTPDAFGAARVRLADGDWSRFDRSRLVLLRDDGSYLYARSAGSVSPDDPSLLEFPRLAPGVWRLVLLSTGDEALLVREGRGLMLQPLVELPIEIGGTGEFVVEDHESL